MSDNLTAGKLVFAESANLLYIDPSQFKVGMSPVLPAFEPSKTKLLKIKDVCDRLNITRQTLHKIIKAGNLKVIRLSARNIRITEHALNELINRGME
jgi:excisionase family DNA binding protein